MRGQSSEPLKPPQRWQYLSVCWLRNCPDIAPDVAQLSPLSLAQLRVIVEQLGACSVSMRICLLCDNRQPAARHSPLPTAGRAPPSSPLVWVHNGVCRNQPPAQEMPR